MGSENDGKGRKKEEGRKCKEAKVKQRDCSHEWGREGSGDCGIIVIEENGISKSSRYGANGGLLYLMRDDFMSAYGGVHVVGLGLDDVVVVEQQVVL